MALETHVLSWRDHYKILLSIFENLLKSSTLVDCTLAADGCYIKAHRVVLSAFSLYLKNLFTEESDKHPIVILKDVNFQDLKAAVDFMYKGEIQIAEDRLGSFLEIARALQMKGLSCDQEETIKITPLSKGNDGRPSVSRISLRRDLLEISERNVEQHTVLPLESNQASENRPCDEPPHLPMSERVVLHWMIVPQFVYFPLPLHHYTTTTFHYSQI